MGFIGLMAALMAAGIAAVILFAVKILLFIAAAFFLVMGIIRKKKNEYSRIFFIASAICAVPAVIGLISDLISIISRSS